MKTQANKKLRLTIGIIGVNYETSMCIFGGFIRQGTTGLEFRNCSGEELIEKKYIEPFNPFLDDGFSEDKRLKFAYYQFVGEARHLSLLLWVGRILNLKLVHWSEADIQWCLLHETTDGNVEMLDADDDIKESQICERLGIDKDKQCVDAINGGDDTGFENEGDECFEIQIAKFFGFIE